MKENKNSKPVSGFAQDSINGVTKFKTGDYQVKSITGLSSLRPGNSNANSNQNNSQTSTGNNQSKNSSGSK